MTDPDLSDVRVDVWMWSVRLFRTRSEAAAACRGGKVKVGGRTVKAAAKVGVGDNIEARTPGGERVVEVARVLQRRVGAAVASECLIDRTPAPPPDPRPQRVASRERGSGRPTKKERRQMDRFRREH